MRRLSPVREALAGVRRALSTPAQHRVAADELQALADELQALADAKQRDVAKPPGRRVVTAGKGGRPSTPWIKIEARPRPSGNHEIDFRLKLSRSLYYAAGSPRALQIEQRGSRLLLHISESGYPLVVNAGGVGINAAELRDYIRLEPGRYSAEVQGNTIIVGKQLETAEE